MPTVYDHGDPTDAEQYMLELINRARADPAAEAALFNIDLNEGLDPGEIDPSPKPPLAFNKYLLKAARGHSQWMIDADTFTHEEDDGSDPGQRMTKAGYEGGTGEAENIDLVYYSGDLTQSVAEAHQDLFVDQNVPGRGHRKILLATKHEIGVGLKVGDYQGDQAVLCTEDFIYKVSPDWAAFLVGVVYAGKPWAKYLYQPGLGVEGYTVTLSKGDNSAVTSSSGGYAIPIHGFSGPLTVTFQKIWTFEKTVNITKGESMKVDCIFPWVVVISDNILWWLLGWIDILYKAVGFSKKRR